MNATIQDVRTTKSELKLTLKNSIAFLALLFMMHEAHEIAHTAIGRLLCGCWGERDFNVWGLCNTCAVSQDLGFIATLAGPLFSFLMMWWGASLLKNTNTTSQKSIGYALIFANMPFARLLTAIAMGGGDEVYTLKHFMENDTLAWIIGSIIILCICIYPLYKAYTAISKRRLLWFLLFFIAPTFIDVLIVLGGMNTLLTNGVLDTYWILGSPILVTVWTAIVILLFTLSRKHIYTLLR
ncbi:hypothetical protein GCM10011344_46010 [Dokdonia pacifica]|uniref:Peptidase M50B-like n=1 Tax=Dokdonia pacifica TaxID=1627892 RepID=A0A239DCM5_9FLAO|nr:hypothetical protein [Dokdonia pacifica]GGG39956.1 hypothetical protein GCM10011344_46010 [Dokdonia pacifica]SNS30047.1 hypothetical protein SAMN06265376_110101 [Dokdonia pacifica]